MDWSSANVITSIKADVLAVCWSGAFKCVLTMPRRKDISNDLREDIFQSGKVYTAISKQFEVHHSTVRKIIHKWERPISPGVEDPENLNRAILRVIAKHPRTAPQTLQASVNMWNVKGHGSSIRKHWITMACFEGPSRPIFLFFPILFYLYPIFFNEGLPVESFFSLKRTWQHRLGL